MKLLLDTHVFIWWHSEREKLSFQALKHCQNPKFELFLSIASLWEIQIKQQLGKLELQYPLREMVEMQKQTNQLKLLPIDFNHVLSLQTLPLHHKDPFDRLIIAQAFYENVTIISADQYFINYPIDIIW